MATSPKGVYKVHWVKYEVDVFLCDNLCHSLDDTPSHTTNLVVIQSCRVKEFSKKSQTSFIGYLDVLEENIQFLYNLWGICPLIGSGKWHRDMS